MESYGNSDTSSESDCSSDLEPNNKTDNETDNETNNETDNKTDNNQPERSVPIDDDEYETFLSPTDQLKAQIDSACLSQLHAEIKARAIIPAYQKLRRVWPL
jgi:hypothetical protein